jgi:hypothetical protein
MNEMQSRPMNSLAVVGFILAFLCAPVGVILSFVARSQINNSGGTQGGKGFTMAGIIIGIINTIINIVYVVIMATGGAHIF